MSLKVKLISTISAFVLVLSMLFVGVFAAQNVSLNVGGNVSFTASSVYAKITGSYVGTVEHPSEAQSLTQIDIDAEDEDGAVLMPSDWTNMPLNFDSTGSDITVTITIENLASDRAITASLTDNTNITGVSVEREYNSSSFEGNTSSQTINGGETGTFTFILSVTDKNNDITGTFDLDINIETASYTFTLTLPVGFMLQVVADRLLAQDMWDNLYGFSDMYITIEDIKEITFVLYDHGHTGSGPVYDTISIRINGGELITLTNSTGAFLPAIDLVLTSNTNIEIIV